MSAQAESERVSAMIEPLWRGAAEVTMSRREVQALLRYYGARHLHMRAGVGHDLKARHIGAGVYSVWLEPRDAR